MTGRPAQAKPAVPQGAPAQAPAAQPKPPAPTITPAGTPQAKTSLSPVEVPTSGPLAPTKPKGTVVPAKGSQTPAKAEAKPAAKPTASSPLMSLGTKAQLAGGAALLGGGMLAHQAIGAAGQVMSRPRAGGHVYGGGYGGPRNVSAYGYPTY